MGHTRAKHRKKREKKEKKSREKREIEQKWTDSMRTKSNVAMKLSSSILTMTVRKWKSFKRAPSSPPHPPAAAVALRPARPPQSIKRGDHGLKSCPMMTSVSSVQSRISIN